MSFAVDTGFGHAAAGLALLALSAVLVASRRGARSWWRGNGNGASKAGTR